MKNSEAAFLIAAVFYAPHIDAKLALGAGALFVLLGWIFHIAESME